MTLKLDKNSCKFQTLCEWFETLEELSGRDGKNANPKKRDETVSKFVRNFLPADLYHLLRLMAPEKDRERMSYNLKESTIGKIYIDTLSIKGTTDADRFTNMRNGSDSAKHKWYSDVIYTYLKAKGWKRDLSHQMSINEINSWLDDLYAAAKKDKKKVLAVIIPKTNALQQKWLIRIILKNLHISGLKIFDFHKEAEELYSTSYSLLEVSRLVDPSYRVERSLKVFNPLMPMLAKVFQHHKEFPDNLVVETKYDGERCMVHKDGNTIKYFSRTGKETTHIYAAKYDSVIMENVKAKSCILDGEILVWDHEFNDYRVFFGARKLGLAPSDIEDDTGHLCMAVFDILSYNGLDLRSLPLQERRTKYLENVVEIIENKLIIPDQIPVSSMLEVSALLDKAAQLDREGIMIKDLQSSYVPGERGDKWCKYKCQFLGETFDLVILGAAMGSKSDFTRFLLGLKKDDDYLPFCYAGSGLTKAQKADIEKKLRPFYKPWTLAKSPSAWQGWVPASDLKPAFWIDPKDSILLEVKALDIISSDKYKFDETLRSPTTKGLRLDKPYTACTTIEQIYDIKNRAKLIPGETQEKTKKTKKSTKPIVSRAPTVGDVALHFVVDKKSTIFDKLEFCLCQDFIDPKGKVSCRDLEKLVESHGGKFVKNPMGTTNYVVMSPSMKEILKAKWLIENVNPLKMTQGKKLTKKQQAAKLRDDTYHFDVITPDYLVKCDSDTLLLDLSPDYVIKLCKQSEIDMSTNYDCFHDSYFESATEESLVRSMEIVKSKKIEVDPSRLVEFKKRHFPKLFDGMVFYLDRWDENDKIKDCSLDILELSILENGGSTDVNLPKTHIIVEDIETDCDHLRNLVTRHNCYNVITQYWINTCLDRKRLVDIAQIWKIDMNRIERNSNPIKRKRFDSIDEENIEIVS